MGNVFTREEITVNILKFGHFREFMQDFLLVAPIMSA
jgi:hypothetical protein